MSIRTMVPCKLYSGEDILSYSSQKHTSAGRTPSRVWGGIRIELVDYVDQEDHENQIGEASWRTHLCYPYLDHLDHSRGVTY